MHAVGAWQSLGDSDGGCSLTLEKVPPYAWTTRQSNSALLVAVNKHTLMWELPAPPRPAPASSPAKGESAMAAGQESQ